MFKQQKTGGLVDVGVMEELARELALAPRESLAFILTEYGKTFSQKGFSQWFNQKARGAGLVNCTAHGVRKGAATIAAENSGNGSRVDGAVRLDDRRNGNSLHAKRKS